MQLAAERVSFLYLFQYFTWPLDPLNPFRITNSKGDGLKLLTQVSNPQFSATKNFMLLDICVIQSKTV